MSWMEARTPRPPADLDARLRDHVAGSVQENEVAERLLGAAELDGREGLVEVRVQGLRAPPRPAW